MKYCKNCKQYKDDALFVSTATGKPTMTCEQCLETKRRYERNAAAGQEPGAPMCDRCKNYLYCISTIYTILPIACQQELTEEQERVIKENGLHKVVIFGMPAPTLDGEQRRMVKVDLRAV